MTLLLAMTLAQDVDKLIRDLGADDADARDRAAADLVKVGWTCHAKLEEALKSSDDPEIRARARQLLLRVYPWFEERKLSTIPRGSGVMDIAIGPHGGLSAYVKWTDGEGACVVINDEPGPTYSGIEGLTITDDGDAVAYRGEDREGRGDLILGKKRYEGFSSFDDPVFSRNSSSWAAIARRDEDYFVLADGRESGPFDNVAGLSFDPDGKLVYASRSEGGWTLATGEKKKAIVGVDWPLEVCFRPGESDPIMVAKKDREYFVFEKGEKRSGGYDLIEHLTFSPDGKRMAFVAFRGDLRFAVVDGEEGGNFSAVTAPRFSTDGRRVAYGAYWQERWRAVVDGKEGPAFLRVSDIALSPDGAASAYAAQTSNPRDYSQIHTGEHVLMHDAKERAKHPWIGAPSFSPDGKKLGFGAVVGDEIWWKVIDVK